MEEGVYVVAGWAQDMCDDNGIPEICVFKGLDKAERYEMLLCDQGFQNTYIYKRKVDEALPVGWETYDIVDFEEIRQKNKRGFKKSEGNMMAKTENNIIPSVSVTFIPVSTHFTAVKTVYKTAGDEEAVTVGKIVVNVPKLSGEFEVQNEC